MTFIQADSCLECGTRKYSDFQGDRKKDLKEEGVHQLVVKHCYWRGCEENTFCWGYLMAHDPDKVPEHAKAGPPDLGKEYPYQNFTNPLLPGSNFPIQDFPEHIVRLPIFQHLTKVLPPLPSSLSFFQNDSMHFYWVFETCQCSGELLPTKYKYWRKPESPATHFFNLVEFGGPCKNHGQMTMPVEMYLRKKPKDLVKEGLVPEDWEHLLTDTESDSESESESESDSDSTTEGSDGDSSPTKNRGPKGKARPVKKRRTEAEKKAMRRRRKREAEEAMLEEHRRTYEKFHQSFPQKTKEETAGNDKKDDSSDDGIAARLVEKMKAAGLGWKFAAFHKDEEDHDH